MVHMVSHVAFGERFLLESAGAERSGLLMVKAFIDLGVIATISARQSTTREYNSTLSRYPPGNPL